MENQLLYSCPVCGRKNFMLQGLKAHRCHAKTKRRATPTGPLEYPKLSEAELKKAMGNAL